jgi:hypothetical protein
MNGFSVLYLIGVFALFLTCTMFKKIARDLLIVFGLLALFASTSPAVMLYLKTNRHNDKWWGYVSHTNGDLVDLSYLDLVKKYVSSGEHILPQNTDSSYPKKHNLYLFGDSYSWDLKSTQFKCLTSFNLINSYSGATFHLDKSRSNILVIEIAERYVRVYFERKQMIEDFHESDVQKKNTTNRAPLAPSEIADISPAPENYVDLFNKHVNQNLQFNLFSYNFILPLFKAKAAFNYYEFNRASGDVVISNDRNYLLLKETVSQGPRSSYSSVPTEELSHIVDNLNQINDYYKSCGFKKVYLSIIPNTATMVQPDGYNNLIPQIQNNPYLRMEIIDVYAVFRRSPGLFYYKGDTHWNNTGKQKFIDLVNEILVRENNN